mgnify:CR=1 FL=1
MKAKKSIFYIFLALFLVGSGISTYMVLQKTEEFKVERQKYVETVMFQNGIMDPMAWMPTGSWESHVERADVFKDRSNRALSDINFYGLSMGAGALFLIILTIVLFLKNVLIWRYLAGCLTIICIVGLSVGVATPMMEMAAFSTDLTIPIDATGMKGTVPMIPDRCSAKGYLLA